MTLSFSSQPPPSEPEDLEPVTVDVTAWLREHGKDPVEEKFTFTCLPRNLVNGGQISEVSVAAGAGDAAAAAAMWSFLEQVMEPEDLVRFDEIMKPPYYVDPQLVVKVSVGLFARYAGRSDKQSSKRAPVRRRR